jgi:hypothetical protein
MKPESYQNLVGDDFSAPIDYQKMQSKEAFRKVDFGYPQQFAAFALKNDVKQFLIISSLGADKAAEIST